MMPPIADSSDPDPTTQIPWPAARSKHSSSSKDTAEAQDGRRPRGIQIAETAKRPASQSPVGKKLLTTWNLITLSVSMAGAQIAWTVELGYGNPFLLKLGLSEQLTSLVWLAGPISGLIAQPLIGAISDSSPSKYRRRYWIMLSTFVLVISTFTLAYCESFAAFFVDLFGVGDGSWDERRNNRVNGTAIGIAVVSFYLLDFALNALQASLRNLLLDVTPPAQLNSANAWHGRMTHAGNIVGYGFGFLPLAEFPIIRLIGGDQFRKFCLVSLTLLIATVVVTCVCHEEEERPRSHKATESKLSELLSNIYNAARKLPRPIQRVCVVQIFAFMGWFPFLFYATTYIGQVMAYENQKEPEHDKATRKGELALLLFSIVSVVSGTLLPHLASRDRRLMTHKGDEDEDAEITRIRHTVREWRADAARKGEPLRLPVMPFLLRNIWTGALLLFTLLTFSTVFVNTVLEATIMISLIGICWSVACWVPFAIIMELLKDLPSSSTAQRPEHARTLSTPGFPRRPSATERTPLVRSRSFDEYDVNPDEEATPVAGGTILGIHNLAIVMPQFIIALVSSIIFHLVDGGVEDDPSNHSTYLGRNGVAWVLRFGGLCTLFGAMLARRVPPTPTEKAMRRRLGEMMLLGQAPSP
ncbi:hypothetical protein PC9H_005008 [Pleurotus ostreatus]|uniref:MFS general substrate transporter n=2 Tax=Pleurotus ostreatus TaxID=5322 RepID=A0A067NQS4_PLEO1|nr:uncharacterized protein PC9H_005008 [Pleurotus ostreatus]KAF7433062.1 hypothetical protein PC9H_005008 [Pleurotus ostreatus]KAJ8698324.1 hypothetical protein PTI98_005045 [Pleurotus ostreatus]KDQ29330.1 hypothetical protein PLEOSDRAFT_1055300 [Pleurotus ostreatus PC15]